MNGQSRREYDSLGFVEVPTDALWGPQTQRARENFRISGMKISRFPHILIALAMTKQAAANANAQLGILSQEKRAAISAACDEIIAGRHHDAFPLDPIQGGAGTSMNMNANEVIASLANEWLGNTRGSNGPLHPNDDVNRSQSTNDVYPTAVRLSLILAHESLEVALLSLVASFEERAAAFATVVKLGRTQLQDAVPMTLGQEFSAFATALREDVMRLREMLPLLAEVNLGGTAIGTRLNAPKGYSEIVLGELSVISGKTLTPAANLVEASWDMGAFVLFSAMLKRLATKLSKIANDLRLLASGPRGGFGEIRLPPMQPGSSIMPGKVNPVIPEVVNQVCFQIIGNDIAITMAAEAGQLQLNAMEPLIAFNLHFSIQLIEAAIRTFDEQCVRGIEADPERCLEHLDSSVGSVTALVPILGYVSSAELAKDALRLNRKVADLAIERGLVSADDAARLLDPMKLAMPV
ncbi:aspartate ammonia-lyase [Mesorhizobium sp. AR07]|uniref:aspartate ammonia-lyase n=1 Tax=Mesorhizobium sp. AR07 TaxID=2865838 RepID=UPI00215FE8EA|nr:aspartate ammonia-lyase [Mesorhizobium sp. AR07]UVK41832.1 aspartate ammonia-lyase [Mesorhizobium sp. AR07]